ncbi:MAG TPA: Fic family protein [Acidobacteriota bacterium]|nr:Fic family protein [Acidobacteriota bacterium]
MSDKGAYRPPYDLTPALLRLVGEIGEEIGRYSALAESRLTPRLRRENRIRTIQASLAIENNTLTVEQVSAVIEGKRVLGHPREIQEVRNAFAAYEAMENWKPASKDDLLTAHRILMSGLVDHPGQFRKGGVGIFRGRELVHMAPPAQRVPQLMADLLGWLEETEEHPLVASCVFHYEVEFIHPFSDGNGRMGRLWQTLILRQWKPLLAFLPVETLVRDRQDEYYRVLAVSDEGADCTVFVEFMLTALLDSLREALAAEPSPLSGREPTKYRPSTDQVAQLIRALGESDLGAGELMAKLDLSHRPTFRENYLNPALEEDWIERTQPASPRSPTQRYRLTDKARRWLDAPGQK